jgi:hypothetical protein
MKLKLILTDSIYFFMTHLPQIAALCLPWLVAGAVIEFIIITAPAGPDGRPSLFWAIAFDLTVLPIYTATLILLMSKQAQNQRPSNLELLTGAIKVWQPFFLLYLCTGVLISLVGILTLPVALQISSTFLSAPADAIFGFIMVLPIFLWVYARLSFAKFYLVLYGLNPILAIQKSFQTTRPHTQIIISLVLVYTVPVMGIMFLFSNLAPKNNVGYAISTLIGVCVSFLLLFVNVLLFRIYMDANQKNNPDVA